MEQFYWLSRERASLEAAQDAVSAEARLIHYDLAGVSPTPAGSSSFGPAAAKSAGALERRKPCSRLRRALHRYIRIGLSALPSRMGTDAA